VDTCELPPLPVLAQPTLDRCPDVVVIVLLGPILGEPRNARLGRVPVPLVVDVEVCGLVCETTDGELRTLPFLTADFGLVLFVYW
jgi:hypothetical protein